MTKKIKQLHKKYAHHKQRLIDLRQHPFVLPVTIFLALFFLGLIIFVSLGANTVGPADARVVNVYADNTARTLPTRAKTVGELLDKLDIDVRQGDIIEPGLDTQIIEDNFNVNVYRARPVTIIDGDKKYTTVSAHQAPTAIAEEEGIKLYPEDRVTPTPPPEDVLREGVVGEQFVVDRATPVMLILYGNPTLVRTHAETVEDLLEEKHIQTSPDDTIRPARDTVLTPNMQVAVTRVGQEVTTVEEEIAPPIETVDDPNLNRGTTQVREEGRAGKRIVTYEIILENGVEVGRNKIQEVVTLEPVRRLVVRGTKIIVSNPSENVRLGEQMAAARGWTGEQWYCLYQLWQKESRWNHTAMNRNSGAYGIPQSLPGSKMASVGADWETNPATQITWGMGYIAGRYGTPCGAWQSSQARGWY